MAPTFGSLFAGIGGGDLGFERAGFRCAWQVENDPACVRVLTRHWPDVPRFGDVCGVDGATLPPVDVVIFGSPCQDLSVAGRRAGLEGQRSGLFYEAVRIIRAVRPAFAVWENVPGALSSAQGRDFGGVLDALADAGAVDLGWRVLDAQWFGVAQRRRRVFLVADFRGHRAAEILFEPDGGRGHSAPRRESGARLAYSLRAGATGTHGSQGWNTNYVVAADLNLERADAQSVGANQTTGFHGEAVLAHAFCGPTAKGGDPTTDTYVVAEVAGSLNARGVRCGQDDHGGHYVVHSLRAAGCDASEDGTGRGTPIVAFNWHRTNLSAGDTAPTITIADGHVPAVTRDVAVRRLTPRECERLQGFPDHWTAGQPDTTRYRQLGNAWCVPVAEWLGRRTVAALSTA